MNAEETVAKLQLLGLKGTIRATGHPEYARVWVEDAQGMTQGRLSIHNGEYSHPKWFVSGAHFTGRLRDDERITDVWDVLIRLGVLVSDEQWYAAVRESTRLQEARLQKSQQWRDENPHPRGKNRKRLTPPDPRMRLGQCLEAVVQETL